MENFTCVVVGGGYAGIHAIKSIRHHVLRQLHRFSVRLVLLDQNDYHLRKVLLFKSAASDEDIKIPLLKLFPDGVEFVQGTLSNVEANEQKLIYKDAEGNKREMKYDVLVLAAGSLVREPKPEQGGIALAGLDSAKRIREKWRANFAQAVHTDNPEEKQRLLTMAIAGGGISGIETSAELAYYARKDATLLGLDPNMVKIYLLNAQKRLFHFGPVKVGIKLERALASLGVTVLHSISVRQEEDGVITLSDMKKLMAGICIWTIGLLPHPMLRNLNLPLTKDGAVVVDACYRVKGVQGVYSIGDCARIIDPASGRADGKTCKEASFQAARLGKIIAADRTGQPAPQHKGTMDFFCFGLGPERGMVWTRQWGLDIIITGKLGHRIRKFTWDTASLLR